MKLVRFLLDMNPVVRMVISLIILAIAIACYAWAVHTYPLVKPTPVQRTPVGPVV